MFTGHSAMMQNNAEPFVRLANLPTSYRYRLNRRTRVATTTTLDTVATMHVMIVRKKMNIPNHGGSHPSCFNK